MVAAVIPSAQGVADERNPTGMWSAVLSMSLCVAMLIAAEFMPVSLLTPIAHALHATEGQAGQAIAISGFFAVAASLLVTTLAGRLDRKLVLVSMTGLMLASLVLVALAPSFAVLMVGRALLGVSIGGFWSLATAVLMRLVPEHQVSKALAVMFAGQAIASAFAAPVGSYLGSIIGWRGVFWALVPIVAVTLVWQLLALPSLQAEAGPGRTLLAPLRRGYFRRGLVGVVLSFGGAFAMFTYLRPFLETRSGATGATLSLLFLALGGTGFIGTWLGGRLADGHALRIVQLVPVVMAAVTLTLLGSGPTILVVAALLAVWGVMNTALPIGWMSWMTQNVGDEAEAAGALMVAAIQGAILAGGALGGTLLDHAGIGATFIGSAVLSVLAAVVIGNGKGLLKPSTTRASI